jgi:flagellar motor switch protein FliN
MESHPSWPVLSTLQVRMKVGLPLHGFRVRDLLALVPGSIVGSGWNETEDVPLIGGETQISWCEFETVDDRIAVRLTRLL